MNFMEIIKAYTPQIALIAPIISAAIAIIVARNNIKNVKKQQKQYIDECNRKQQESINNLLLEKEKMSYEQTFNQGFIKPYFILKQNGEINKEGKGYIFNFSLRNIGMASAVNVQLIHEEGRDFFECGIENVQHKIEDYFDKDYAEKKEEICFTVLATNIDEKSAYKVEFEIMFKDILGRCYKQKFKYLYQYSVMKTISKDLYNGETICIEDIKTQRISVYENILMR